MVQETHINRCRSSTIRQLFTSTAAMEFINIFVLSCVLGLSGAAVLTDELRDELRRDVRKLINETVSEIKEEILKEMAILKNVTKEYLPKFNTECNFPRAGDGCLHSSYSESINFISDSTDHTILRVKPHVEATAVTVCGWFYDKGHGNRCFFSLYPAAGDDYDCNTFQIWRWNEELTVNVHGTSYVFSKPIFDNRWVHICAAWGRKRVLTYINGELEGQVSHTRDVAQINFDKLVVGNDVDKDNGGNCIVNDAGQSFRGKISEMYVWEWALNENDVGLVYRGKAVQRRHTIKSWVGMLNFEDNNNIKKEQVNSRQMNANETKTMTSPAPAR